MRVHRTPQHATRGLHGESSLRNATQHSALYEGWVRHRRFEPIEHEFRYPLFMAYLDLAELPELLDRRWLWSARHPSLAWFRRADFLGDPAEPLEKAVRDLVEQRIGRRPPGPIRLLTHLRYFGHSFNPVSLYYCFAADGERLEATVAEVTNTPWGERHCYVVEPDAEREAIDKRLHVSPFMGMDHTYELDIGHPGTALAVTITSRREGQLFFDAVLSMRRVELTGRSMARALIRFPAITLVTLARIYGQALRLKLKGAEVHRHPEEATS